jgi:hypothetical protein
MNAKMSSRSGFNRRGIALLAALLFLVLFSAFSIGVISLSTTNLQTASNHHKSNLARFSAESGLEYVRYQLSQIRIPGTLAAAERFAYLAGELESSLNAYEIPFENLAEESLIFRIGTDEEPVLLQEKNCSFSAVLFPVGTEQIRARISGRAGGFERTIQADFAYGTRRQSVFDFGVATKGPLSLWGNIQLEGVNISVESDVYIESEDQNDALTIVGNSQIAGDVKIVNSEALVTLQGGKAGIGGQTGQEAIDNHVQIGVPATEFPYPNTDYFERYVDGITITADNKNSYTSNTVLENVRIAANANPSFSGDVTLKGVVFVEYPNQVVFTGNTEVIGIIVGDGDLNDHSGTSRIEFLGNVSSRPVSELPAEQYGEDLTKETGTFLMAPGFSVSFGGSFDTLNGCIAANGVTFFGNAGGIIGGSVINYSPTPMTLSGNADLYFNRTGITSVPAGFFPEIVIHYDPASYQEVR